MNTRHLHTYEPPYHKSWIRPLYYDVADIAPLNSTLIVILNPDPPVSPLYLWNGLYFVISISRYTCCCQCHVKRRLPPAGPTHVHHPFINNLTSDVKSKHPIRNKLKSKCLTRFWWQTTETNNLSGSYRTRTEYRNRKKGLCWASSDENIATNLLCQRWWKSLFRKKQQIMRIMCRSVIFVIIISVCGVLMYSDSHQQNDFSIDYYPTSDHHIDDYYSSGSSNVILVSSIVPIDRTS